MKIYKAEARVAMHLVPSTSHLSLRRGCACRSKVEGIFVKKLDVSSKYHVYVHDGAVLPETLETTVPEKGPGRVLFKPKPKKERKKAKEHAE